GLEACTLCWSRDFLPEIFPCRIFLPHRLWTVTRLTHGRMEKMWRECLIAHDEDVCGGSTIGAIACPRDDGGGRFPAAFPNSSSPQVSRACLRAVPVVPGKIPLPLSGGLAYTGPCPAPPGRQPAATSSARPWPSRFFRPCHRGG